MSFLCKKCKKWAPKIAHFRLCVIAAIAGLKNGWKLPLTDDFGKAITRLAFLIDRLIFL